MIPPIQAPSAPSYSTDMTAAALRRFEIAMYAEQGTDLKGELDSALFSRVHLEEGSKIVWELKASQDRDKLILDVVAKAQLVLECQRCLQPMTQALLAARTYWYARSQMQLERWEEELGLDSEVDVMLLEGGAEPRIDLITLMEDELILALPYAPKHESCPSLPKALQNAMLSNGSEAQEQAAEQASRMNPFAILGSLKRSK